MEFWRRAILAVGMVVLAAVQPAGVSAQQAAPNPVAESPKEGVAVRIAVIDIEEIRRNAKAVKSIRAQVDEYRKAFGADAQKEDEALRKANEELARQRAILAPEVFSEERRKFEQQVAAFQGKVQVRSRALDTVYNEAVQVVQKELNKVIIEIANEGQFTLILRQEMTVVVASQLEITAEALKRLDAKLATVKVSDPNKVPAPQSGK